MKYQTVQTEEIAKNKWNNQKEETCREYLGREKYELRHQVSVKQKRKGSGGRKKQPEIFLRNILKDTEKKLECEI